MLILACGNLRCGDDAAGILVGKRLLEWGFEVEEFAGDGLELLEKFRLHRELYLIDAVVTGKVAGTVHVWDERDSPVNPGVLRCSTHKFGIPQAVHVGRRLGRLPTQFRVYGIEGRHFVFGAQPTQGVLNGVEHLAGLIAIELAHRLR